MYTPSCHNLQGKSKADQLKCTLKNGQNIKIYTLSLRFPSSSMTSQQFLMLGGMKLCVKF